MIHNQKFDEARKEIFAFSLIKPRSDELVRYSCLDCAFHTDKHFEGEDETDCFRSATISDYPFTCLYHCKSLFNHTGGVCENMMLKPMNAKFNELQRKLDR